MSKFDGFTRDVENVNRRWQNRGCSVGAMLAALDAEDRAEVQSALDRRELTSVAIYNALLPRVGSACPSSYTINRHRNQSCTCEVETK
ncbi:hypothetical protein [Streptomyces sp. I8-5]|uniref:hypothetical protein n=1 Tax=Streptomyces sp. I8-5 TaxID=3104277 RepID=UPI00386C7103